MITGATSGIGLRTMEVFVAEGAKIVIAGPRIPEGEALARLCARHEIEIGLVPRTRCGAKCRSAEPGPISPS